jgi:hypothetical protein
MLKGKTTKIGVPKVLPKRSETFIGHLKAKNLENFRPTLEGSALTISGDLSSFFKNSLIDYEAMKCHS